MISPFVQLFSTSFDDSRFELLGERRLVSYQCHANCDEWWRVTIEIEKEKVNLSYSAFPGSAFRAF
jgi:hypothetical protein